MLLYSSLTTCSVTFSKILLRPSSTWCSIWARSKSGLPNRMSPSIPKRLEEEDKKKRYFKPLPYGNRFFRSSFSNFGDLLALPNLYHLGLGFSKASFSNFGDLLALQSLSHLGIGSSDQALQLWRLACATKPLPLETRLFKPLSPGNRLFRSSFSNFGDLLALPSLSHLGLDSSKVSFSNFGDLLALRGLSHLGLGSSSLSHLGLGSSSLSHMGIGSSDQASPTLDTYLRYQASPTWD
ncbi:hypothetical protein Adt_38299 [Abeliophyllum distichum]|uniref:Uncharacterized protein n=1 Tax=Abeliophyllum distichum TaxID=126358 RepID=A0ABD1Q1U3_9LAMI